MNENSTNTELLIQYLDGELHGEQLETFKKNLEANPALREELENLRLAREAVSAYGLQKKIRSIHPEMMRELKVKTQPEPVITRMIFQYSLRVAAVLIILFGFPPYINIIPAHRKNYSLKISRPLTCVKPEASSAIDSRRSLQSRQHGGRDYPVQ